MKKLFAILLIVLAVTPLFASEGQIGATLGYQNAWLFEIEGNDTGDMQSRTLVMSVNGANYFGSNGGFGVEYGIGMTNLLNTKYENLTVDDEEFDPGLILNLGVSYRYGITDMIGISAGLGLSAEMDWANGQDIVYIQKDVDLFEFDLGMYGKIAADFTFFDDLRLNVGLEMGGPLYKSITAESNTESIDISAFYLTPYVSLSYKY